MLTIYSFKRRGKMSLCGIYFFKSLRTILPEDIFIILSQNKVVMRSKRFYKYSKNVLCKIYFFIIMLTVCLSKAYVFRSRTKVKKNYAMVFRNHF